MLLITLEICRTPTRSTLFPYTTLFRSHPNGGRPTHLEQQVRRVALHHLGDGCLEVERRLSGLGGFSHGGPPGRGAVRTRRAARSPPGPPAPRPRLRTRFRS